MVIMSSAHLSRFYLVTPEPDKGDFSAFLSRLEQVLQSGIRLVQLRARTLNPRRYQALAREVLVMCHRYQALLLLNAIAQQVMEINADGIHLSSIRLMLCKTRPLDHTKLVSVACHSFAQLKQAEYIGADFVTLAPVLPTPMHSHMSVLGWEKFRELAAQTTLPIYAFGGMEKEHLPYAQAQGAYGIAAIRDLWNIYEKEQTCATLTD